MFEFGFLREDNESALKAGLDSIMNKPRTGLNIYLQYIFPEINDWIHDKVLGKINNISYRCRPDYRSETLKMIIEFDGLQHYNNPNNIIRDIKNTKIYKSLGYKVIRIPYFIQLTKTNVEILFNKKVNINLFPENIPSLYQIGTPAYLCILGIIRMAMEFRKLNNNDYYQLNLNYMKKNEYNTSGWQLLDHYYNSNYCLKEFEIDVLNNTFNYTL